MRYVNEIKGFKVFNADWTCRGFQYEVGKTFEIDVMPDVCNEGLHFCKKAVDCFNYYEFDSNNKVAEVIALGAVDESDNKCATDKLHIVRELTWYEVLELVNIGKGNTGLRNTGNGNTGNWNTGDWNTGNGNTGDGNTGNGNTGNGNTGDGNTGNGNTGDGNTGNWNTGNGNTGNRNTGNGNTGKGNTGNENTGNENTGNWNKGNWNTGNWNTGDRNTGKGNTGNGNTGNENTGNGNTGKGNTGNRNTGNWNTGDRNTGKGNTGDGNQGALNTGDFNISDYNTGCFNTEQHTIKIFDADTDMTLEQWRRTDAYRLLRRIEFIPTTWIWESDMTDAEKEQYPSYETTGGYLRTNDLTQAYQNWWDGLSEDGRKIIMDIPNFDVAKFKLITGIDVRNQNK